MKIFHNILCFSILILAIYIDTIASSSCDGHNVTHVAMFPCPVPDGNISCKSVTMNDLIATTKAATDNRNLCSNKVVFQQGSYEVKKINSRFRRLSLIASEDLVIRGQGNVTITCINDSTITLSSAFNIKIREIEFQACSITVETPKLKLKQRLSSTGINIVVVTNSTFYASHQILSDPNSKLNITLVAILQTVELINASLTLEKVDHINITGQVMCTPDSKFILDLKAKGTIKLSDVKIQDCSNVIIRSRSSVVTFETNNALFENSCLIFEPTRTKSSVHNIFVSFIRTKILYYIWLVVQSILSEQE